MHLKTLSSIAKILNSADTRNRLAEAKNEEEILDILANRQAA
jgi:mannitol/fructose-specific phosphotransferase system IIA component (Ntr-type)